MLRFDDQLTIAEDDGESNEKHIEFCSLNGLSNIEGVRDGASRAEPYARRHPVRIRISCCFPAYKHDRE